MEKEALIKIIIQDVRELETLLNTFSGKSDIPKAFLQLSRNKARGILEEIDLLENLIVTTTISDVSKNISTQTSEEVTTDRQEIYILPETDNIKTETIPIIQEQSPQEIETEKTDKQETVVHPKEKVIKPVKQDVIEKPSISKKKPEPATLGEKLMQGNQSFYDTLAQNKETASAQMFQNRPVKDIMSAIGINDRFYFQKELFGGDNELFKSTVSKLNSLTDMESAETLFADTFEWDEDNEAVQLFKNIIRRKYL